MKNAAIHLLLVLIAVTCLFACSSPEKEGKKIAEQTNICCIDYFNDIEKCENDFCNEFYASQYSNRTEAIEKFQAAKDQVFQKYEQSLGKMNDCFTDKEIEFAKDYAEKSKFLQSYYESLDLDIQSQVLRMAMDTVLPDPVRMKIKTIIPPEPEEHKIIEDLTGHSLAEGLAPEDCWFSKDWRWPIKEGQIKDFYIHEVLQSSPDEYSFIANMVLQGENTDFNASVLISYVLPEFEDWRMDYVISKGLHIIPTHKYDDVLNFSIKDNGWFGTDALIIHNPSEVELIVFGFVYVMSQWKRFSTKVGPGETKNVGGLFCGGEVTNFRIEHIERL